MKYHNRNVSNLNKLADNTKAAAFKWYQYCIDNGIEVLIYETIRTVERQREYVRKGASQTMRSYHLVGQALDFVPIQSNGTEDWNSYNKEPWASAIRYANKLALNGAVTGKDLWIVRICNITTKGMERILLEKVLKT